VTFQEVMGCAVSQGWRVVRPGEAGGFVDVWLFEPPRRSGEDEVQFPAKDQGSKAAVRRLRWRLEAKGLLNCE
jgi:hypothetical protein